jgi:hypothetical protein
LEIYDDAVFISPKTYGLKSNHEEIKFKGISSNILTFKELKQAFYNEKEIIFEDQLIFNRYNFNLNQKYIEKKVNLNKYDKRIFTVDKKRTTAINQNTVIL